VPSAKDLVFKLRSLSNEFRTDEAARELDQLDTSLAATARQASLSAREVRTAASQLEAPGFDKAAAEAEATARRMRAAAEDMAAGVRQGATKIDTATDKIRTDMADTGREAGSELVSNIAEGIGSGTGSVTDVVQGTLGGITAMAASIPGPFAVAGASAAAGIGILFSSIKRQADESRERVKALTSAILDTGKAGQTAVRQAALDQWEQNLKDAPDKARLLAVGMRAAGLSAKDVQAAVAGTPSEAQAVLDKIERWQRRQNEIMLDSERVTVEMLKQDEAVTALERELRGTNKELQLSREQVAAIESLTGKAGSNTEAWKDDVAEVTRQAKLAEAALDRAFRDRTVRATVIVRDQAGRNIRLPDPRSL
jgi:hypothetical protein